MCSLGLLKISKMTAFKTYQMRTDMADWEGLTAHTLYASMHVARGGEGLKLTLGEFLGGEAGKHSEYLEESGIFYYNCMTLAGVPGVAQVNKVRKLCDIIPPKHSICL